jgi:hypothetical protein
MPILVAIDTKFGANRRSRKTRRLGQFSKSSEGIRNMNVSGWGLIGRLWQSLLDASETAVMIHYRAPWASPADRPAAGAKRHAMDKAYGVVCEA